MRAIFQKLVQFFLCLKVSFSSEIEPGFFILEVLTRLDFNSWELLRDSFLQFLDDTSTRKLWSISREFNPGKNYN